jgi:hypothetical protein
MKLPFVLSTAIAAALVGCDAKAPPAEPPAAPAPDVQATAAPQTAPAPAPRSVAPAPASRYSNGYAAPQYAAGSDPDDEPPPIYVDYRPPLAQPDPIEVPWAPPPMLVEAPPPPPSSEARWTGGYWVWRERWVWAPGRWADPPRPQYHWEPPYYEHRRDHVVFVDGFWAPPGRSFVPPPSNLAIALAVIGAGIALGRPPVGPEGVFVPPPPGSRRGLIVPAPIGTAPAVMTGAPPIIGPGMRVTTNVTDNERISNNSRTTIVNNITHVTIEAPPNSTASHQAVHFSAPAQAHLAAALPPVERTRPVAPVAAATAPMTAPLRPAPAAPAMTPPAPAGNATPPDQRRLGDEMKKRPEPIDRSRASTEAVPNSAAPAPAMTAQPPKQPEHVAAPKAAVPPPPIPAPSPRPDARASERPAAAIKPMPPHPADAPKVESAPRPQAHPADARAPDHPAAPPPAAAEKPKAEKPKPVEAPPKKSPEPPTEAEKKKERDAKGEPPR